MDEALKVCPECGCEVVNSSGLLVCECPAETPRSEPMNAQEFYEANATKVVNVPRPGHPEDPSGWDGVRRASEAQFIAKDVLVMTLADAFDFAEKYKGSC